MLDDDGLRLLISFKVIFFAVVFFHRKTEAFHSIQVTKGFCGVWVIGNIPNNRIRLGEFAVIVKNYRDYR